MKSLPTNIWVLSWKLTKVLFQGSPIPLGSTIPLRLKIGSRLIPDAWDVPKVKLRGDWIISCPLNIYLSADPSYLCHWVKPTFCSLGRPHLQNIYCRCLLHIGIFRQVYIYLYTSELCLAYQPRRSFFIVAPILWLCAGLSKYVSAFIDKGRWIDVMQILHVHKCHYINLVQHKRSNKSLEIVLEKQHLIY